MLQSVPILETERLRLRAHGVSDFSHLAEMWADSEVTRYIGGHPLSTEDCWARLLRYAGHWQLLGFGYWLVEERSTGKFVGDIGFADYKREVPVPASLQGVPECGWVLARHAQGKGYATEAVRAVLNWGDDHFGSRETVCLIHPDNGASIRVALKCGYRELQRSMYRGQPTQIFVRPGL